MPSSPVTLSEWGKFLRDLFRIRALRSKWRSRIPLLAKTKKWRRRIDRRAREEWRGDISTLKKTAIFTSLQKWTSWPVLAWFNRTGPIP